MDDLHQLTIWASALRSYAIANFALLPAQKKDLPLVNLSALLKTSANQTSSADTGAPVFLTYVSLHPDL